MQSGPLLQQSFVNIRLHAEQRQLNFIRQNQVLIYVDWYQHFLDQLQRHQQK